MKYADIVYFDSLRHLPTPILLNTFCYNLWLGWQVGSGEHDTKCERIYYVFQVIKSVPRVITDLFARRIRLECQWWLFLACRWDWDGDGTEAIM